MNNKKMQQDRWQETRVGEVKLGFFDEERDRFTPCEDSFGFKMLI